MAKPVLLLCLWAGAAASPDSISLLQVAAERKPTRLTEVVKHVVTRLTGVVKHVEHVEHVKHVKHVEHEESHSHAHHSHAHHSHAHHSHAHHVKHEESEEMQLVKQWTKDEGLPHMLPEDSLSDIPDLAWPPAAEEEADPEAFAKAMSKAVAEADSVLEPLNPGEAAEEAPSPVTDAVNVADFAQALTGMDQAAYEAASHKINQGGYQKIVRLLNTSLMESFIRLTVLANGGMVKDPDAVAAMAPEHSGEKGAENFEKLLVEVKAGAWNTVGEDVATDVPARAPLDADGYELVAALHDTEKMSQFIRRVIEANAGTLVDPRKVEWYAKYYSGEKAKQSFKQMVHQLKLVDWVTGMKPLHTKSQDPLNHFATAANASADAFEEDPFPESDP